MARAHVKKAGEWKHIDGASRQWRVDEHGVHILGRNKPMRRADGQGQHIAERVLDEHRNDILLVADVWDVDVRVIIATVCIESAGMVDAERYEKHLDDWSFGLTQTLTNTAWGLGRLYGFTRGNGAWEMPEKSVPRGGDPDDWRRFLFKPLISLALCAGYHNHNDRRFECDGDPVLLYACYNAGSPRFTTKNAWGLVNYGAALDAFCGFYGHACELDIPPPRDAALSEPA